VGIVRFTVHQAKDFEDSGVHPTDLNTYAKVYLGSSSTPIHTTFQAKRTAKPAWESTTEFFCANRSSSIITVKVVDRRDNIRDPILGFLSVRLQDLLDTLKDPGHDWWPLSGCKSGRVRLTADWRPLNVAGGICSADQYVPPIGVVRLWLKQATDVKNVEATLGSKVR
jgi:Ca2+-dependent lipid-binding protein